MTPIRPKTVSPAEPFIASEAAMQSPVNTLATISPARMAPTFRSRCAGRSTYTIFCPCSSHTSYFSLMRSICWRSRKTSRSKARSACGAVATAAAVPGARFSRPHCGHFTSRPANSSFSSYDVPHWHKTRTDTVAPPGPELTIDQSMA